MRHKIFLLFHRSFFVFILIDHTFFLCLASLFGYVAAEAGGGSLYRIPLELRGLLKVLLTVHALSALGWVELQTKSIWVFVVCLNQKCEVQLFLDNCVNKVDGICNFLRSLNVVFYSHKLYFAEHVNQSTTSIVSAFRNWEIDRICLARQKFLPYNILILS